MNELHVPRVVLDKPGRGRVYRSILETIGNTPMVQIGRLAREAGCQAEVLAKLEFFNRLAASRTVLPCRCWKRWRPTAPSDPEA